MLFILIFLTAMLLIVVLIINIKIDLYFSCIFKEKKGEIIIHILLLHKVIFRKEILLKKSELSNYKDSLAKIHQTISIILQHIKIRNFSWESHLGFGRPDITGVLIGNVWSIKGIVIAFLSKNVKCFPIPQIIITPNFKKVLAQTELNCIGSIRIGEAISTLFNVKKINNSREDI